MGVFGDIALQAWKSAAHEGVSPPDAWRAAIEEQYPDPTKRKNALKHTCPKGAFLGLCQKGIVRGIRAGNYTDSVKSSGLALSAVERLKADPSLAARKSRLVQLVFGNRAPAELDVVLALWEQRAII